MDMLLIAREVGGQDLHCSLLFSSVCIKFCVQLFMCIFMYFCLCNNNNHRNKLICIPPVCQLTTVCTIFMIIPPHKFHLLHSLYCATVLTVSSVLFSFADRARTDVTRSCSMASVNLLKRLCVVKWCMFRLVLVFAEKNVFEVRLV